jgi:DNA-binding transcriptional LysR family regulator
MLRESTIAGHGIARIASYFVEQDIQQGKLMSVLADETEEDSGSMYLLYPQLIHQSKKTRSFIAFVKTYFQQQG